MRASPSRWRSSPRWAASCWALFDGSDLPLSKQVAIYCGGLFICCMVCHGELYRLKPDPRHLTGYYLMIAAGGALGGLFVAVAAPAGVHGLLRAALGAVPVRAAVPAGLCDRPRGKSEVRSPKPEMGSVALDWPARWRCWCSADSTGCLAWLPAHTTPSQGLFYRPAHRHVGAAGSGGGLLDCAPEVPELSALALPDLRLAVAGPDCARRDALEAGAATPAASGSYAHAISTAC